MAKVRVWDLLGRDIVWQEVVDEVFRKFLRRLRAARVCLVLDLKDSRDGKPIDGLGLRKWPLCINAILSEEERLKTLIHELSHLLFPESEECEILEIERVLYKKFSKKQKDALWAYVPKRPLRKIPTCVARHR